MAKLSKDLGLGTLHPRETIFAAGNLAAAAAEIIIPADGCSTVSVDLRGTFSLTFEVAGTLDGTNWTQIPVRAIAQSSVAYLGAVTVTAGGVWAGKCAQYKSVRVRCTSYASGAAAVTIAADSGALDDTLQGIVTTSIGTATGASGAAVTLTLAAPGAGLRQYLTYLSINRFAAAVLTASATPVVVTTSNLPGALAFTFAADAAGLGTIDRWREDFSYPIAASAHNVAVTVVCPVTTGVIWRVTSGYYVAP